MERLFAAVLVGVLGTLGCADTKPGASPQADAQSASKEERDEKGSGDGNVPSGAVAASQLFQEYEANAAQADGKYRGKVLRVTGEVMQATGEGGPSYVYLAVKKGTFGTVKCALQNTSGVKQGMQVTIEGKCEGKSFVDIVFSDCRLIGASP